ncbi:Hypothetical protein SRAE_0000053600 [Strongyloides ratti]|uniref:Uncharacterized protein n=1 Tax=Strongyloides ratti TaxID=34506 RepID=A0A090KZV5_STRRB|nr:Hypothetical protein SRAE_0000053600 [Strongyloides ratti]CEF61412.1 Hypothetical protein SRAE_0000053600 [Strongyloides ratti]
MKVVFSLPDLYKPVVTLYTNTQQSLAQYDGPYEIIEHIHGDSYLIQKISSKGRRIESTFKTNARLLKLVPKSFSVIHDNDQDIEPHPTEKPIATDIIKLIQSSKKR